MAMPVQAKRESFEHCDHEATSAGGLSKADAGGRLLSGRCGNVDELA